MLAKPQRPKTNISFNTPDIQKTDLTKSSIAQIIHCIFGFCLSTRLLSMIASFVLHLYFTR